MTPDLPPLSHYELEDIELSPFPKHPPLRPDRRSRLRALWKQRSIRIALGVLAFVLLIVSMSVAAMYVGRSIQMQEFEKHPDLPITITVTPSKVVTTVAVTATAMVAVIVDKRGII